MLWVSDRSSITTVDGGVEGSVGVLYVTFAFSFMHTVRVQLANAFALREFAIIISPPLVAFYVSDTVMFK